jgi:predicted nucleic acid-binding protein
MQVLQEYVAVTRKLNLDVRIARRKLELLAEFDVFSPDLSDILAAIDLQRLHNFSFWDALIIRAAKQARLYGASLGRSANSSGTRRRSGCEPIRIDS